MDITANLLRFWRDALLKDNTLDVVRRQSFSKIIEKYLVAAEKRGWGVGVNSAKNYIELAEGMRPELGRWEEGREALRWLLRHGLAGENKGPGGTWKAKFEWRLRELQYAERTVETYSQWLVRFSTWCKALGIELVDASGAEVRAFLDMLAVKEKVRIATQHQALNGLVRFYVEVMNRPLSGVEGYLRARRSDRVPVVLSESEMMALLDQLEGTSRLMGELMYGGGLRLMELLRLRVKDVDVDRRQVVVRGGKGDKDRVTTLAERTAELVNAHFRRLRGLWQEDVRNGVPGVWLPPALGRKYPGAGQSLEWQWMFPGKSLTKDPESGLSRRHHLNESQWQQTIKSAGARAALTKRVTPHVLRHSFDSVASSGSAPPSAPLQGCSFLAV